MEHDILFKGRGGKHMVVFFFFFFLDQGSRNEKVEKPNLKHSERGAKGQGLGITGRGVSSYDMLLLLS